MSVPRFISPKETSGFDATFFKSGYDPETPNLYKLGGLVQANQLGRPNAFSYMKVKNMGVDQVPTLLQHGEIVIPVKYADKVAEYLKNENINLPNMK